MSVVISALGDSRVSEQGAREEMDRRRSTFRWRDRDRNAVTLNQMNSDHLFYSMRYLKRKADDNNQSMFNRGGGGRVRPLTVPAWSFLVMFDEILRRYDLSGNLIGQLVQLIHQTLGPSYVERLRTMPVRGMIPPEAFEGPFMTQFRDALNAAVRPDRIEPIERPTAGRESDSGTGRGSSNDVANDFLRLLGTTGISVEGAGRAFQQAAGRMVRPRGQDDTVDSLRYLMMNTPLRGNEFNYAIIDDVIPDQTELKIEEPKDEVDQLTTIGRRKIMIEEDE